MTARADIAMPPNELLIRNISDTALWAAAYRARESERSDALFRDPFARRLAGERGQQAIETTPGGMRHTWAWVTRTWLFDQFIIEQVRQGADLVVNLAAGLDARPYRMELPASLRWVEVDLPDLLTYKEEVLAGQQPRCTLERLRFDLSDAGKRREVLDGVGRDAKRGLVITEGLLIYLSPDEVASLARDLAALPGFQHWVIDLASPGLLHLLQKHIGGRLTQAGAPLKFGPPEGVEFFAPCGWRAIDTRSMLKTAARLKRLSFGMRLLSLLPESRRPGRRPWSGVCLLRRE